MKKSISSRLYAIDAKKRLRGKIFQNISELYDFITVRCDKETFSSEEWKKISDEFSELSDICSMFAK